MSFLIDVDDHRQPDYPVAKMLYHRWSPRAMSGEPLTPGEVMTLFDAARWAPSCFNEQPWRFLYATRESAHWDTFFELLVEGNQKWAHRAALLVVIVSRHAFARNDKPSRTHSFDAGAAWQNLALQGSSMGLVVHGMAGFDYERARQQLGVPAGYAVEAMAAAGRPGRTEDLEESLREREAPSPRSRLDDLVFEGRFPAPAA